MPANCERVTEFTSRADTALDEHAVRELLLLSNRDEVLKAFYFHQSYQKENVRYLWNSNSSFPHLWQDIQQMLVCYYLNWKWQVSWAYGSRFPHLWKIMMFAFHTCLLWFFSNFLNLQRYIFIYSVCLFLAIATYSLTLWLFVVFETLYLTEWIFPVFAVLFLTMWLNFSQLHLFSLIATSKCNNVTILYV